MKIINSALVLLSSFAIASARHLQAKKTNHGAEDDAVKGPEMQGDLAPASRKLWKASSYIEHCGCVDDFIKDLAAAQYAALSNINTIAYELQEDDTVVTTEMNDITGKITDTAVEAMTYLQNEYLCGCGDPAATPPPTDSDLDDSTTYYQECCCDAGKVKDLYIHSMQGLADIPNEPFLLGVHQAVCDAIIASDEGLVAQIPTWNPAPPAP